MEIPHNKAVVTCSYIWLFRNSYLFINVSHFPVNNDHPHPLYPSLLLIATDTELKKSVNV